MNLTGRIGGDSGLSQRGTQVGSMYKLNSLANPYWRQGLFKYKTVISILKQEKNISFWAHEKV